MTVPILVVVSPHSEHVVRHAMRTGGTLVTDRWTAQRAAANALVARGGLVVTEPDTYYRTPGCDCCSVREDLVDSVVRAVRRATPPEYLILSVDPHRDDVLTVVSTLLSEVEISRRCSLDGVVVHVDATQLSTRHAVGEPIVDARLTAAVAIADRIVLESPHQLTQSALEVVRGRLAAHAGFALVANADEISMSTTTRLDAWHGAPAAASVEPETPSQPGTVVLSVDDPLDAEAIDDWLDHLIASHASRLLRIQGALSVVGHDERTCCFGVRSFADSHSEAEHPVHRSTESVLAICGIGLDAEELAASFRSTVAS